MTTRWRAVIALLIVAALVLTGCGTAQTDPGKDTPSAPEHTSDVTVTLNEYATTDTVTLADEDGDFVSWVELWNYGGSTVKLNGFTLSDDDKEPDKWAFPDVTLEPDGYLTVYLSGKVKPAGETLHASFKLTGKEESLTLFEPDGTKVEQVPVTELVSNLTCGHPAGDRTRWQFFPKATPGAANTVTGFDEVKSARYPQNKSLMISEVAPVTGKTLAASDGAYYDYVELYNPTGEPVSLTGCRLSDRSHMRKAYTLTGGTVPAGGYYLLWCGADEDHYSTTTGQTYLTMGLNRYGETLYLTDADGVVLDGVQTGRLDQNSACGRASLTDDTVVNFNRQTPGQPNPTAGLGAPAASPVFSVPSGYVTAGTAVSITATPGAEIRYTLDGSTPTRTAALYTAPLTVSQTVTVRAVAYEAGRLPSESRAGSYIVGRRHTLPVMFLSTDPANFFDYNTGIWADGPGYNETFPHTGANYWKDWERPVHVEYMDKEGKAQLEFDAGVKIFGQYSRANKQKSLSVNLRDKYGVSEVCYPFFGEDSAVNVYSELVLRASGQDYNMAHMRDAFCSEAIEGQMDLDYMDYQPIVVYLNGEYWGLYDLREKVCESYVANRTGCDEQDVTMIKGNSKVMAGSYDEYRELLDYVEQHDLKDDAAYAYVAQRVDVQELLNYWIAETFFVNTDTGNIKFYKAGNGKWRWVMFDYDWALFPSTHDDNYLKEFVNPKGHGVGQAFSTTLMRGLMRNKQCSDLFLKTYIHHLNTTFSTERLLKLLDDKVAEIADEMPYQIERWQSHHSVEAWQKYVGYLRNVVESQNGIIRENLIKTVTGQTSNSTLNAMWRGYYGLSRSELEAMLNEG